MLSQDVHINTFEMRNQIKHFCVLFKSGHPVVRELFPSYVFPIMNKAK